MKIATIVGARPQFIKAAIVSKEISKHNSISEIIIHTGQHFDANMSEVFFKELGIPKPKFNLKIANLTHGAMTGRMLEKIEPILKEQNPDFLLVYGDTNSTLAGALAASKIHVPVAHVEAGLRSFNRNMPEEINRVLTDHISDLLFAPSKTAASNLLKEGISKNKIYDVGDVMYDACLYFSDLAKTKSNILSTLRVSPNEYILSTVHRQENTDNRRKLTDIFSALSNSKLPVVMPLHPRTLKKINEFGIKPKNIIKTIEPVGYIDMVLLQKYANKVFTDSGGLQKESYFLDTPCIVMREETEWVELIKNRKEYLVGANKEKIEYMINKKCTTIKNKKIYGSGNASQNIIKGFLN